MILVAGITVVFGAVGLEGDAILVVALFIALTITVLYYFGNR